jgi:hypothetical protein
VGVPRGDVVDPGRSFRVDHDTGMDPALRCVVKSVLAVIVNRHLDACGGDGGILRKICASGAVSQQVSASLAWCCLAWCCSVQPARGQLARGEPGR